MRRANLTNEQAKQIMETVNPLGLCDSNGRLIIFRSAADCYCYCLSTLFYSAPRGWIDIPLFMLKNQHIKVWKSKEYCGHIEYAIINWECKTASRDYVIKKLLIVLLKVTGIEFSENAYKCALHELNETITNYYKQR